MVMRVVERMIVLDHLSRGRALFGIGRGLARREYDACGVDMNEARDRFDEAIGWYLKGLDADPIVESFYQGLMRCYGKLDRRTESIAAYRRLKQTLSITLGLAPSPVTEKLYQSLRGGT